MVEKLKCGMWVNVYLTQRDWTQILENMSSTESNWAPLMTEESATKYTKDSYYAGQNFYHGTSQTAADGITTTGARLSSDDVNSYGDGFYLAFDKDIAVEYANQASKPVVLTILWQGIDVGYLNR